MRKFTIIFLLTLIFGCTQRKPTPKISTKLKEITFVDSLNYSKKINKNTGILRINQLNNDSLKYFWHGGTLITFYFTKNKANYAFSVSDGGQFRAEFLETKIILYWCYDSIIGYNKEFVKKYHNVISSPKDGDSFAELFLINDSTLKANYHFNDWIKAINKNPQNSVFFPTYYYLNKP